LIDQTAWLISETRLEDPVRVLRTTNAGATWIRDVPAGIWNLRSVWFEGANGCAVGDAGTILLTDDSGVTWARHTAVPTADDLLDVTFADADTGWAVGANGVILSTVTGGSRWQPQKSGETSMLNDVFFLNAKEGWVAGDRGTLLHTTDGGATWQDESLRTHAHLTRLFFIAPDRGWAVGGNGVIFSFDK